MDIKKVLLVGYFTNNNDYCYAESFYNNFIKLDFVTKKFNYRKKYFFIEFINNWIINLILILYAKIFKPDLIFLLKAESVKSKTVKKLKDKNILLVNFYPDNIFTFWNGNSNAQVLQRLPYFDCFLNWGKFLENSLKMAGAKDIYYFPFAYDKNIYKSEIALSNLDKNKYRCDVCFAGTWDKEREVWLTNLCNAMLNLNLVIWGNLWLENLDKDSILRNKVRGPAIYKDELIKLFKSSKIVLNFIRVQNLTSHNMRTLEVSATKSFLLTQRTQEQAEFLFKEGESIECFGSVDELVDKIKFYLENSEKREYIIANSYAKVQEFELSIVLKNFMQYIQNHDK